MAFGSTCPAVLQLDVTNVRVLAVPIFLTTTLLPVVVMELANFGVVVAYLDRFAGLEGCDPFLVLGLVCDLAPSWVFFPVDC